MSRLRIARAITPSERTWPWLGLTLVVAGALVGVAVAASRGAFEAYDTQSRILRGYTAVGLVAGGTAVFLALCTFLYSLRKRTLQERFPLLRGTMMAWLSAHVWLGVAALIAAVVHGGAGLVSYGLTSGKVVFGVFAALAVSGIVWRIIYKLVPPVASPQIGNYSQVASHRRAEEQLTEIEKLAAGRSPAFHGVKDFVLAAERGRPDVERASAAVPPQERQVLAVVVELAASRNRALRRQRLQANYTRILQGTRIIHVPLTFLFFAALAVHVVGAFELPAKLLPVGTFTHGAMSAFESSRECATCHGAIYAQWSQSMHAHAMTSPLTIVQNNQDIRTTLAGTPSPDPQRVCINCHSPTAARMTTQVTLPLGGAAAPHLDEGVSCTVCHQYDGKPQRGGGGLSTAFLRDLVPGRTYFGPFEGAVGNSHHKSDHGDVFAKPEMLCMNCHDVVLDRNKDGKIVKGDDLVLQTTFDEFAYYAAHGGKETCVSCHMPVAREKRAASSADVPLEQDTDAPPRVVHDHSFVGVDYPLDSVVTSDPQKPARAALLKSAVAMELAAPVAAADALAFDVSLTNVGAGHDVPTGFAFARQMWLEVTAVDDAARTLLASGVLTNPTDDLCDAATMGDEGGLVRAKMQGCAAVDAQLVNFQKRLMDKIERAVDARGQPVKDERGEFKLRAPAGGHETWLQHLTGGPVVRVRPSDRQALDAIMPGQRRTFAYVAPFAGRRPGRVTVTVRLLFRNLPPYFLRGMADAQPKGEVPALGPLVKNLQTVEMASEKRTVDIGR